MTPLRWFAVAAVALVASAAYSTCARVRTLPSMLGYAPKESRLVVATGEIEELWRGVSHHFFSRQTLALDSSPLEEWVAEFGEKLAQRDVVIGGWEDLATYGVDGGRGMVLAVHSAQTLVQADVEVDEVTDAVVVVPVTDYDVFITSLARVLEAEASSDTALLINGSAVPVTAIGSSAYAIEPEDGVAVVGSSTAILARSAASRRANLRFFRANDILYAGIRRLRDQARLRGPTMLVYARPPSVRGIGSVTGVVTLALPAVELMLDVQVVPGFLRVLDDLTTAVQGGRARMPPLPQTVGGALVATDDDLYRSLPLERWLADVLPDWPGPMAEVIDEVRNTGGVDQLALTIAGSDDGVPEAVLLVRGTPDTLDSLVSRVRRRLVSSRDRVVLEHARDRYRGGRPTVRALLDEGLLTGGDDERWAYYHFAGDEITFDTTAPRERLFPPDVYERRSGDLRVHLLSPPVTADDLRYNEALAEADRVLLISDRYRFAAARLDSALWLAPDAELLVAFLRRLPPAVPALVDRPVYRAARRGGPAAPKLELFLDIDRLIALGLLDTDADVQATARRVLAQLRDHQAVAATLARTDANHLRLTVRLLRSGGEPPR